MAAYTRCLRCVGAPGRPASGSGLSLLIPSWHAVLSDPGESDIDICSRTSMPTSPSPHDHRLGTPNSPAIRSTRASHFVASLVRFRCGLPGCSPPCTDRTGTLQPSGAFTTRLSTDWSPSPLLVMTTTVTGLLLLAGLSPAGMAASLAARSKPARSPAFRCLLSPVRTCRRGGRRRQWVESRCGAVAVGRT